MYDGGNVEVCGQKTKHISCGKDEVPTRLRSQGARIIIYSVKFSIFNDAITNLPVKFNGEICNGGWKVGDNFGK